MAEPAAMKVRDLSQEPVFFRVREQTGFVVERCFGPVVGTVGIYPDLDTATAVQDALTKVQKREQDNG